MRALWKGLLASLACATLCAGVANAQQQRPAIVGRVTERGSNSPIPDANVVIVGMQRGARTDENGSYRIADLAPGTYTLRVTRLGYSASARQITVAAAGNATVDFLLQSSAVQIDQVVVTATGATERKRENGNDVGIIKPGDNLSLAAEPNLTSALAAKTPGLTITQGAGTAGTAARIRIRGANSVSLSNDPLLIVDGVRMDNSTDSFGPGVGGASISRFDDINPEDVESIEVLKGPAASALYGTAAANGVIQVTTKRGAAGRTQWRVFTQYGNQWNPVNYGDNYYNVGTTPAGGTYNSQCTNDRATQGGICTQGTLAHFNPAEFYNVYTTGNIKSYGLSVSGGGDATQYFVSGDADRQVGAISINTTHNYSLRANLTTQLTPKLNATFTTNYVDRNVRLPDNDNDIYGPLGNILLGKAFNCSAASFHAGTLASQCGTDTLSNGFYSALPSTFYIRDNSQWAKRFVGGATVTWQPLSWLTGVGQAGVDMDNLFERSYFPSNVVTWVNAGITNGSIAEYRRQLPRYSTQGSFTANKTFGAFTSSTVVGGQYLSEQSHWTFASGTNLIPGTGSLAAASANKSVNESNQTIITIGSYAREQVGFRDRLFVTGSIRADENSAFGKDFKLAYYPALSASWVASEEPFLRDRSWIASGVLSQLRFRAAYGQSGQRPGFRQADTYLAGAAVTQAGQAELPAVVIGGTGNPELKPEISTEYEGGFDVNFFHDKVGLQFTHYAKTTKDALIARVLAPSLGVSSTQFVNLGQVFNGGNELALNGTVLDQRNVRLEFVLAGSTLKNRLDKLGQGIASIIFDPQRHVEHYSLGGFWAKKILSYSDANGDGVLSRSEVNVDDAVTYVGPSLPKFEFSLTPTLTVFGNVKLSALVQHRGGNYIYNQTEEFRCTTSAFANCREDNDPTAPLVDQAAVIAYQKTVASGTVSHAGFIQKGDFTKLRELSATYTLPQRVSGRLGLRSSSITLAGRNLATWTQYRGADPEIQYQQQSGYGNTNFGATDFLTQAPFRQFVARLDLGF
ncbi:MAG TPA: SusC/RagA family TonB-linked outer membrane protein [Gemmatimonadaceae bacterium]|jgi:TonB-linked SusC/RagA family outer membrane protein